MDEARLNELRQMQSSMMGGMNATDAIVSNTSSGVDPQQTVGFIGFVDQKAEEWQTAKSFYNGAIVSTGRGILGLAKMIRDKNVQTLSELDPTYNAPESFFWIDQALNSSAMQRYNTDNTFVNNLVEGAGQLAAQVAVASATGGIGSTAFMGAQIAGNQYNELIEKGVDIDRAAQAGIINAVIQAPMERLGLGAIMKGSPAASALRKKLLTIGESLLTEGITEALQEFPEQLTNIWALNEGIDAKGIAREWDKNAVQNLKDAGYSGLIGSLLGGAGSGVRVAQMSLNEYVVGKVHEEKLQATKEYIEEAKKSGVKPEFIAATINNNLRGTEYVSIDAEALQSYMQQTNAEEVAESLGVSVEEVAQAAEVGLDVEVAYGNFAGTAVKQGDSFFQTVEEHIAFEDTNGFSVNANKLKKALRSEYEITEQARENLNIEVDQIIQSATDAGVSNAQTSGLRELLISRAMIANPENPAQFFKDHPLEFNNAGKIDNAKNLYRQAAMKDENRVFVRNKNGSLNYGEVASVTADDGTVIKGAPIRLQVGYQVGKNTAGAGLTHLLRRHSDLFSARGYVDANGNVDVEGIITQIWNNRTFTVATIKDGRNNLAVYQEISPSEGLVMVMDLNTDPKTNQDYYSIISIRPVRKNQLAKEKNKALSFNGARTTQNQPAAAGVGQTPAGNNAASPGGSIANEDNAYGTVSIDQVSAFVNRFTYDENGDPLYNDDGTPRLKQENNAKTKGAIQWEQDGSAIINLFKGADASTVIHETGHYFVEAFMQDSALETATERSKKDRKALLEYVGMTEEQWINADFEGRRAAHEKLAEGFETYIMEGKAPNKELRSVFKRFADWLKTVYQSISRNPNAAELTDDVRNVFDHWLASEDEIKAMERIDGYFAKLPSVITDNLNDSTKAKIQDFISTAHDKAIELMTKESMRNFTAERKEAINNYKAQIKGGVEQEVAARKVYQSIDALHSVVGWKSASAKTIARKYLSEGGKIYSDFKEARDAIDADINDRVQPLVDSMVAGIDKNPRTYWIDKETGKETDVSDLEATGADELKSGFQFQKVTEDNSADWYNHYKQINGKRISKKKIREIAIDALMGKDPYGVLAEERAGLKPDEFAQYEKEVQQRADELQQLLDRQKNMQAQSYEKNLFKPFSLTEEQRVWFDSIAESFGYGSGSQLAQEIQKEPTYSQAVNQRIDEMVQLKFPDIYKERELAEQAARESLYNDDSGMVIAVEQQLIEDFATQQDAKQRSADARKKLAQQLKSAAENGAKEELARMPIREALKTRNFIRAERRAAANAQKALKAKDFELAREYKRQQAINHAMVRESLKMRQKVERSVKFIKRQVRAKKEIWGQEYHFNQAANLLARMGVGRKDYDPANKMQTLQDYVAEQKELGNDADIAEWLFDEAEDISDPSSLTYDQYLDVVNALRNIRALALAERKQFKIEKDKSYEDLKAEMLANLNTLKDEFTPVPGERPKPSWWSTFRASLRNTDNLFERMDGWANGYFSQKFGTVLKHCADAETKMTMDMERRIADAYKKWLPTDDAVKAAEEKVYYEELGASVDKFYLVQMLANMGNAGNARVLCGTPPIGLEASTLWVRPDAEISVDEAVEETKANLIQFLSNNLTKSDIDYAQSIIDNADRHWAELADVERRTKGFAPPRVVATPIALTLADGSVVAFKGGYLPLVMDSQMGAHPANQNSVSDTDPNQGRNVKTLHTNTGTSKARKQGANYPVNLARGAELRAVRDTIHDICYRETIADFRKILNDPEMFAMLKTKLGIADFQQFREMLEKTANPYGNATDQAEGLIADTASWLRRKTVNAAIMLNLKTAFQNLGNITLYGNAIEGFDQADAWRAVFGKWGMQAASLKQTEMDQFIMEKSPFMAERVLFPDISVKEVIGEGKQNKIEEATTKWGAMFLAYTDNLTAKPVWMAAYEKRMRAGATEQEAIDFADTVIRRTLGSSRMQDVSSLMRGGPIFKLLTTFQGFFNTQYNQWEREGEIFGRDWSAGKKKEAVQRLIAFAAAKWALTCLMACTLALENPFEDDDKGYSNLFKETMQYPLSMFGPYGQAGNMMINSMMGISTYSYRLAAIQSTIDRFNKLARTSNRVVNGKAGMAELIEGGMSVAGPVVGVPDQFNKLFWNSYDALFNDMQLELHDLVARRPKSERK